MTLKPLDEDLQDLSSAEEFLNYFGVAYDPHVVHVNRLHILQRFHDYLTQSREQLPEAWNRVARSLQAPADAGLSGLCRLGRPDGEGVRGVPRGLATRAISCRWNR